MEIVLGGRQHARGLPSPKNNLYFWYFMTWKLLGEQPTAWLSQHLLSVMKYLFGLKEWREQAYGMLLSPLL